MNRNVNPADCYTSYIVTKGRGVRRQALTAPAYSYTTAQWGDVSEAHVFSTGPKASCCVRDIDRATARDGVRGGAMSVTPILVQRRRAR
jgi:hypothetical protein